MKFNRLAVAALLLANLSNSGIASPQTHRPRLSSNQAAAIALNKWSREKGTIRLLNPRHRANFTSDGVEFVPKRRGPAWSWQLAAISIQDKPISIKKSVPQRQGQLVDFRRGPITERYVAHSATVEQQFILKERLFGDVVIEGCVRSPGEFVTTKTGWAWKGNGGQVSLGKVFVFDAMRHPLEAEMDVWAEGTRITIKEDVLARAAFPVTIDPEIGTDDFRVSDMGPDGNASYQAIIPAVAYNSTNNEFLVVWYGDDNTGSLVDGEYEIYGQRIDAATGAEVGTNDFRISDVGTDGDNTADAEEPAVAYNSTNNEYLVVWDGDDDAVPGLGGSETEIYGQRLDGATGAEIGTNDFRISDMGPDGDNSYSAFGPEIAYNVTNNEYLVVWFGNDDIGLNKEAEIYGQRINAATGAEVGTNDFRISDMGTDGNNTFEPREYQAVAYNSTNNEYLVVWYGADNIGVLAAGETEIYGQRINAATGAEVGTNDFRISDMGPDGNAAYDAKTPWVAYNRANNEYLVVWSGDDNTGSLIDNEFEIYGQRINAATGAEVGTNDFRISDAGPDGNNGFYAEFPRVAYSPIDREYFVTWSGDDDTGTLLNGEEEIFGQRITAATGAEVGDNDFRLSSAGPNGNSSYDVNELAMAYNSQNNSYLVAWWGDELVGLADEQEVFGQLFSVNENGTLSTPLSDIRGYPSPASTGMTFDNLPSGAIIRIYTVSGRLVRQINAGSNGFEPWDLKNDSQEPVASGVYVVFVEHNGSNRSFKVAVQR